MKNITNEDKFRLRLGERSMYSIFTVARIQCNLGIHSLGLDKETQYTDIVK